MKVKKVWYHVDLSGQEAYDECYVFPIEVRKAFQGEFVDCILLGYDDNAQWMAEMWEEREIPVIKVDGHPITIWDPEKHIKCTITIHKTTLDSEYLKDGKVVTKSTMKKKGIPSMALDVVPQLIDFLKEQQHCTCRCCNKKEEEDEKVLTFIFYKEQWHYEAGQVTFFSPQMEEV